MSPFSRNGCIKTFDALRLAGLTPKAFKAKQSLFALKPTGITRQALTNSGSWSNISCIVRRQTGTGERENGQIVRCNAAWGG